MNGEVYASYGEGCEQWRGGMRTMERGVSETVVSTVLCRCIWLSGVNLFYEGCLKI